MSKTVCILLALFLTAACGVVEKPMIAVAANFKQPLLALQKAFMKKNPRIRFCIISGSSGKLATQIVLGAEYDLFLSADFRYPRHLQKKGLTIGHPREYAQGKLVLFMPQGLTAKRGINNLKTAGLNRVIVANTNLAPYGRAASEALDRSGLQGMKSRLVYAANVMLAFVYTVRAAGAGFVARSLFYVNGFSTKYKEGIHWVEVDRSLYRPIRQAMVLLKNGRFVKAVRPFYDFILSEEGGEIIRTFGYNRR